MTMPAITGSATPAAFDPSFFELGRLVELNNSNNQLRASSSLVGMMAFDEFSESFFGHNPTVQALVCPMRHDTSQL